MTLIKDKHHLLLIDGQVSFGFHQVIEFLNSCDDNFVIVLIRVSSEACCIIRTIDTVRREALILLHGLVIEVFPVDHEEDFIDKVQLSSQTCGLKAGQGFPDPVVCQINPPLSGFDQFFALKELLIFQRMRSVAAI